LDNTCSPIEPCLNDVIDVAFPRSRADSRRTLLNTAVVRQFRTGQAILQQGDESSLALILDGHVAARRTTDDGRQLIFRIFTRGGLVSILPLCSRPSSADIVALSAVSVAMWRAMEVRSLATTDPGLAVGILDNVLSTFEDVVTRLDGLLHQDALRRVARVLSLHADLFFADPPVITRSHLPAMLGTSREMTGRVLRVLESRQVVARVGRDRLLLLDAAALAATADAAALGRPEPSPRVGGAAVARDRFQDAILLPLHRVAGVAD
jgi:CRP-like cAMP-binding protein